MQGMGRSPRHCRGCGKRFYFKDPALADSAEGQDDGLDG
jgi:hypothetical protein